MEDEQRRLDAIEVARAFNVPPYLLGFAPVPWHARLRYRLRRIFRRTWRRATSRR